MIRRLARAIDGHHGGDDATRAIRLGDLGEAGKVGGAHDSNIALAVVPDQTAHEFNVCHPRPV
jgi:hypothetical protein